MTQEEKDRLTRSEILERLIINELPFYLPGIDSLVTSPIGSHLKWDFIINNRSIGDIKVRYKYPDYPDYVLEKAKYDYLISTDYKEKLYMNIFLDGTILIWDLNAIIPNWFIKPYTKNNSVNNKEKIDKETTNLNVTDAIVNIKTDISIVKLSEKALELFENKNYF